MNFIGFVEHVDHMRISGWARSLDDEALRPMVVAALDEIDVGNARAASVRPDLVARGIGDGDHGFEIAVIIPLKPEDAEAMEVSVIGPDGARHRLALLPSPEEQDRLLRPAAAAGGGDDPAAGRDRVARAPPDADADAPMDLLAGRATDPESDLDPFADLDLRRDAHPPAAPPQPPDPAPSRADEASGKDPQAAESDPGAEIDPFAGLDLQREARPGTPAPAPPPATIGPATVAELKIFVLGAARSGTSALFTALSSVLGLPGYGESHVIPAFQRMIHQLRQYVEIFDTNPEDIMIKHMGAAPVEALLFAYVRDFYREAFKSGGFVDKTPTGEAIYGAPLIEAIFPEAYLIATRRNGIEVVQSFRLKFSSDFADACLAWSEAMSGILHARARCQNLIEIDQFDMANQPERTGRRIAAWLGFPEHGAALGRYFARERIEKSSTHDWSRRLTLADVDWTPAEKATFTRICGRMMEQFDYPM